MIRECETEAALDIFEQIEISPTRRKRLFCDSDWRFGHGVIQSTVVCSKAGPTPIAYVLPASGLTTVL